MKKTVLLIATLITWSYCTQAQKIKEKDILGTWKLIINIEEEMEKEAEKADTMLEEILLETVSGFVDGILDDVGIYFEFQKDHEVIITVSAYGDQEEGKGRWLINNRGYLEIENIEDNDDFNLSTDDEWKLIDGILVSDEHEDDRTAYMTRVDKR